MDSSSSPDDVLEMEDLIELTAMHRLGVDRFNKRQYGDAEVLFKQVLAGREEFLGTEHKDTLSTMHWLACVYECQQ